MIPDPEKSLFDGAIQAGGWATSSNDGMAGMFLRSLGKEYGFDIRLPWKDLPQEAKNIVLYGSGDRRITVEYSRDYGSGTYSVPFEGVINGLMTARIGIAAMDLCRPLPFRAVKRPGIGDFMSDLTPDLTGGKNSENA